jgi:hypothetical protein
VVNRRFGAVTAPLKAVGAFAAFEWFGVTRAWYDAQAYEGVAEFVTHINFASRLRV